MLHQTWPKKAGLNPHPTKYLHMALEREHFQEETFLQNVDICNMIHIHIYLKYIYICVAKFACKVRIPNV